MPHKPIPPATAEQSSEKPPTSPGSCEIILFPDFDISAIARAPELWNRPAKPRTEPAN